MHGLDSSTRPNVSFAPFRGCVGHNTWRMWPASLDSLPPETQAALRSVTRAVRYARGNVIYRTEEPAEVVYTLASGRVRLYRIGASAREVTVAVHAAGEWFGLSALMQGRGYGMYAEAMEDCEAWAMPGTALRELQLRHPALGVALSAILAQQIQDLQRRLSTLVFLEVSQRLALVLLDLAQHQGTELDGGLRALNGRISHQDLAHLVGSTRETITKLLGEFKARGLLDLGYRRIVIMDEAGLSAAAKEPIHTA